MIYMKLFVDKNWIPASAGMTFSPLGVNINEINYTITV